MEKKKCRFCDTEYWEPPGGHECFSVPNQLLAELVSSARVLDNTPLKMRRILGRIERLLKKGGE
jgi:hypothetical protein